MWSLVRDWAGEEGLLRFLGCSSGVFLTSRPSAFILESNLGEESTERRLIHSSRVFCKKVLSSHFRERTLRGKVEVNLHNVTELLHGRIPTRAPISPGQKLCSSQDQIVSLCHGGSLLVVGDWRGYPFVRGGTWGEARAPTFPRFRPLPLLSEASHSTSGYLRRDRLVSWWWLFCSCGLASVFPYLRKMCDTGRKAGVIRQRRQFFDAPLWKLRMAALDAPGRGVSRWIVLLGVQKEGLTWAQRRKGNWGTCQRLLSITHLFTEPQTGDFSGVGVGWGWDGRT